MLAKEKGLISFSKHPKVSFVDGGYTNWKKATERFKSHEKSLSHTTALSKLDTIARGTNVLCQLNKGKDTDMKHHREMLLRLLRSIRFLARQGLPFRGHKEDTDSFEGNLYQLLLLQCSDVPRLSSWLSKREYISPQIVNELITLLGNTVLRQLLHEIKSSHYFSVIADEATDVAHNEQLCLAVRWVDTTYCVHEAAIALIQLPDTKALTIFSTMKDILIRCSLPLSSCIGQAYDGASNMSGARKGVQALMKKENKNCLYVHCFAHTLNLCIQDVVRQCELLSNCIEFMLQLIQLIKYSPKRLTIFESFRANFSLPEESSLNSSLRPLCPTRWTVRHSAIKSVLDNYKPLMSSLEVIQQGRDEYAAKGRGLLTQMESFDTFFSLKLGYLVFAAAEQFSVNLQAKDTTVGEGLSGAKALSSYYSSLRNEDHFIDFYRAVVSSSHGLTDDPVLPRYRRRPRRIDDGAHPHCFASPEDRYRQTYFQALEYCCEDISNRFIQSDLGDISLLEKLLLDSANGVSVGEFPSVVARYFSTPEQELLKTQLSMLSSAVHAKSVTTVRTVCEVLSENNMIKNMLPMVHKLVSLYLTFPVTSATAERSFSSLRRLKTYLRSCMTSKRLNNLFLLYTQQGITDSIDIDVVAKEFILANTRRRNYFGTFD